MRFTLRRYLGFVTALCLLIGGCGQRFEVKRGMRHQHVKGFGCLAMWKLDYDIMQLKPKRVDAMTLFVSLRGIDVAFGMQVNNWEYRWE